MELHSTFVSRIKCKPAAGRWSVEIPRAARGISPRNNKTTIKRPPVRTKWNLEYRNYAHRVQRPFSFFSSDGFSSAAVQRSSARKRIEEIWKEEKIEEKKKRRLKEKENEPRSGDSVPANRLAVLKFLSMLNTYVRSLRTSDRLTAKLRDPVYDYFHAERLENGFIDTSALEQQAVRSFNNHEESGGERYHPPSELVGTLLLSLAS